MSTPARKSSYIDVQLGTRMRQLRRGCGVTQEALAELLGVTHQQVQKYERGVNRISAARLHDIASVLHLPVASFFPDPSSGEIAAANELARRIHALGPRFQALVTAFVTEMSALAGLRDGQ